jgi:hypothetical protein
VTWVYVVDLGEVATHTFDWRRVRGTDAAIDGFMWQCQSLRTNYSAQVSIRGLVHSHDQVPLDVARRAWYISLTRDG